MNELNILELFGYAASVVIAVSLMMSSILKLRWLNLIGSILFSMYGFIIGSLPVGFLNLFIATINIYYLVRLLTKKELFKFLEINWTSDYLRYFLEFHKYEILKFIPDFNFIVKENTIVLFLLRNMIPAGLFLGEKLDDESLVIFLDYAIPEYRDLKLGKFLYGKNANYLKKKGYKILYSYSGGPNHEEYLEKMGFVPSINRKEYWKKIL